MRLIIAHDKFDKACIKFEILQGKQIALIKAVSKNQSSRFFSTLQPIGDRFLARSVNQIRTRTSPCKCDETGVARCRSRSEKFGGLAD